MIDLPPRLALTVGGVEKHFVDRLFRAQQGLDPVLRRAPGRCRIKQPLLPRLGEGDGSASSVRLFLDFFDPSFGDYRLQVSREGRFIQLLGPGNGRAGRWLGSADEIQKSELDRPDAERLKFALVNFRDGSR